jgi:hypothetical protein
MNGSIYKTISGSIYKSISGSIDQSINQSVDQSISSTISIITKLIWFGSHHADFIGNSKVRKETQTDRNSMQFRVHR